MAMTGNLYFQVDTDGLLKCGQFIGGKLGHQLRQPFFVDGPDLIRFGFCQYTFFE
jgi:hypothetical protein